MLTAEIVSREVQKLPEMFQKEVLDFVEFLLSKTQRDISRTEDREWNKFSLAGAMKGMEDEEFPDYSETNFTEKWQ